MPQRPSPRPRPQSLPFEEDAAVSQQTPHSAPPPPTAFITYTHDTPEHKERVLKLTQKLRADGVDCDLDAFQVSPSEGWPAWMLRAVQTHHFCIVVCTETYARRFDGNETPGQGKGAVWEGRAILQRLYESGKNDCVIPVVFAPHDVPHIPLLLKGATHYILGSDLGTDDGYIRLHRALTNQPLDARGPVGPLRRRLPRLDPCETQIAGLLHACNDPVPIEVVARATQLATSEALTRLERLIRTGIIKINDDLVELVDRSVDGLPTISDDVARPALGAVLDFIARHRARARAQMMNAVALAQTADIHAAAVEVSRAFHVIQSLLKSSGNKRLVLDVARRSIAASRLVPPPRPEQVKDEAVALICGVSWVYQRTGRLSEALVEAESSLDLGNDVGWERNTAFCKKCIGRLKRLVAETEHDDQRRRVLLKTSVDLLRDAIGRFAKLEEEAEIGDCYSLLARTYLAANQLQDANRALREAEERLVEPETKDYIDCRLVEADLLAHTTLPGAEDAYTAVLAESDVDDVQKSEIFARAYLHRGRVRLARDHKEEAFTDFRRAADIWDNLGDPTADIARWEMIARTATWVNRDTLQLLKDEAVGVGVRVRVARLIDEGQAERDVARARRSKLTEIYLRGVIKKARNILAEEQPKW